MQCRTLNLKPPSLVFIKDFVENILAGLSERGKPEWKWRCECKAKYVESCWEARRPRKLFKGHGAGNVGIVAAGSSLTRASRTEMKWVWKLALVRRRFFCFPIKWVMMCGTVRGVVLSQGSTQCMRLWTAFRREWKGVTGENYCGRSLRPPERPRTGQKPGLGLG